MKIISKNIIKACLFENFRIIIATKDCFSGSLMECLEYCPCPYDNKTNENASEHSKLASLVSNTNVLGDKIQTDSRSQKSLLRSQS